VSAQVECGRAAPTVCDSEFGPSPHWRPQKWYL